MARRLEAQTRPLVAGSGPRVGNRPAGNVKGNSVITLIIH